MRAADKDVHMSWFTRWGSSIGKSKYEKWVCVVWKIQPKQAKQSSIINAECKNTRFRVTQCGWWWAEWPRCHRGCLCGKCHFMSSGMQTLNKSKHQCPFRLWALARQREGSHARQLEPWHGGLTPAITSALGQRPSCWASSQLFLHAMNMNMKPRVQCDHVSVSKYLSPWRHFVLVTSRKRESILVCGRWTAFVFVIKVKS